MAAADRSRLARLDKQKVVLADLKGDLAGNKVVQDLCQALISEITEAKQKLYRQPAFEAVTKVVTDALEDAEFVKRAKVAVNQHQLYQAPVIDAAAAGQSSANA